MRLPIKALKELAIKYNFSHIIVFARESGCYQNYIATYGGSIEQCSQAADFGNKMKKALKWPESLQIQPSRVKRIQKELKQTKEKIDGMAATIVGYNSDIERLKEQKETLQLYAGAGDVKIRILTEENEALKCQLARVLLYAATELNRRSEFTKSYWVEELTVAAKEN